MCFEAWCFCVYSKPIRQTDHHSFVYLWYGRLMSWKMLHCCDINTSPLCCVPLLNTELYPWSKCNYSILQTVNSPQSEDWNDCSGILWPMWTLSSKRVDVMITLAGVSSSCRAIKIVSIKEVAKQASKWLWVRIHGLILMYLNTWWSHQHESAWCWKTHSTSWAKVISVMVCPDALQYSNLNKTD